MLHRVNRQLHHIAVVLLILIVCAAPLCAAPLAALAVEAIPAEEMPAGEETGEETAESAWAEEELAELDDTQRNIVEMYDAVPGQLATVPLTGDVNAFWETEDGLRYRLFEEGTDAVNTWVETEDGIYYFGLDGYAVTSLQTINSHTYFFRDDYTCAFGAVLIGEDTFFFTPAIGMNHGWVQDEENDARYFLNEDGTAYTGWMEVNGFPTFYFGADGKLCIGWADIDGQSYIFDSDGKRQSGWVGYNGDLYYLGNHEEAVVQKKEWVSMESDGKRRYVQSDGKMAYDVELDITGLTYTFDADGVPHLHIMSGIRNNMVYLVSFIISTIFIFAASLTDNRRISNLAGIMAIAIMVFIAAVRGDEVGYDLRFYVIPLKEYILDNNAGFIEFYKHYPQVEPLYLLMEYICVKIFRSHNVVMGVIALLTNSFFLAGIRNRFSRDRWWFAWIAYCFLIHNLTFNIMRQFISVAVLYYLFSDEERLNWKRVILFSLLAASFHFAGFIGIIFYMMHLFVKNQRIHKAVKAAIVILILIIPIATPSIVSSVLEALSSRGLMPAKYNVFIAGNRDNHSQFTNRTQLLMVALVLCIIILRILFRLREEKNSIKQMEMALQAGIDLMFSVYSNALNIRFQYFFCPNRINALSDARDDFPLNDRKRTFVDLLLLIVMFVYWYRYYVFDGLGGVCPYKFFFQ